MGPHGKMKLIEIFENNYKKFYRKKVDIQMIYLLFTSSKKNILKHFNQINCNIQVKSHVKLIEQTICNCCIGLYQNTINMYTYYFAPYMYVSDSQICKKQKISAKEILAIVLRA